MVFFIAKFITKLNREKSEKLKGAIYLNNANITEKFALCMLQEKKNLYAERVKPYLIASMIIEMLLNGNLEITDKDKVVLCDKMPTINYNKKLYEIIKDMKKDKVSLRIILSSICFGFSTKNLKSIIALLKDRMLENELITLETKKGLVGYKEVINADENKFKDTIEEIRAEFLENGNLTDESILLASLLNSTKFLKSIFNKYEKEKLNMRLEEIKDTEIAEKVKVAQATINTMNAIITAMMVNAAGPV